MSAKALIAVDLQIALLREQFARGGGAAEAKLRMDQLLKQRGELIEKMVAERVLAARAPVSVRR